PWPWTGGPLDPGAGQPRPGDHAARPRTAPSRRSASGADHSPATGAADRSAAAGKPALRRKALKRQPRKKQNGWRAKARHPFVHFIDRRKLASFRGRDLRLGGGKGGRGCLLQIAIVERLLARLADVPDDAEHGERPDDVIGNVDFPPEESLVGGTLIMMVVVV